MGRSLYILTQIFLARKLGPDGFGLYALGWTVIRMVGSISMLGLDFGVIRFGAANFREKGFAFRASIRQSLGLATLSGFLSAMILFAIASRLANWLTSVSLIPILQLSALGLFFFILFRLTAAATVVTQKMIYSVGLKEFVQPLSNIGFVLFFAWLGWGPIGALFALSLSFLVAFFAGLFLLKHLLPELFYQADSVPWLVKPLLAFSIPVAFTTLFSLNILWVDRLIVGVLGTNADLGIYQAVSQSSLVFASILTSMNVIFVPMIADLLELKKNRHLETLFRVSTKWGLYISFPLAFILLLKPETFLIVAFGSDYGGAFRTLQILTIAQLINVATGAINLILIMGGYQIFWMLISASMLLMNVVVGIVLVPRLGIEGAAWGTVVAMLGLGLGGLFYTKRKLNMWPYDRRYLKGITAILFALIGGLLINNWQLPSLVLELGVTSIVICALFFIGLLLLGIDDEDWIFIDVVKSRVFKLFTSKKTLTESI